MKKLNLTEFLKSLGSQILSEIYGQKRSAFGEAPRPQKDGSERNISDRDRSKGEYLRSKSKGKKENQEEKVKLNILWV